MPKDKGRVEWAARKKMWRAVGYKGHKDIQLGYYATLALATGRLRKYIEEGA